MKIEIETEDLSTFGVLLVDIVDDFLKEANNGEIGKQIVANALKKHPQVIIDENSHIESLPRASEMMERGIILEEVKTGYRWRSRRDKYGYFEKLRSKGPTSNEWTDNYCFSEVVLPLKVADNQTLILNIDEE